MTEFYISNDRYLAALHRQRDRIVAGLEFEAEDSEVIGDKFTHASWGLCSKDAEAWPDAEDHIWPEQFSGHGRVAPKHRNDHQPCPMQTKGGGTGCFYSCRIFRGRRITKNTREEAIALYDDRIAKAEAAMARKDAAQ